MTYSERLLLRVLLICFVFRVHDGRECLRGKNCFSVRTTISESHLYFLSLSSKSHNSVFVLIFDTFVHFTVTSNQKSEWRMWFLGVLCLRLIMIAATGSFSVRAAISESSFFLSYSPKIRNSFCIAIFDTYIHLTVTSDQKSEWRMWFLSVFCLRLFEVPRPAVVSPWLRATISEKLSYSPKPRNSFCSVIFDTNIHHYDQQSKIWMTNVISKRALSQIDCRDLQF